METTKLSGFANLGEQLRAIAKHELNLGARMDERLGALQLRSAPIGGSEQTPSDGGFAVAPEFTREIVKRLYQTGEIFRRCTKIPITSSDFSFPQFDESSRAAGSRLGGIEGFWFDEGANLKPAPLAGTNASMIPRFNRSTIKAHKAGIIMHVTDELGMDTDAFGTWATYAASEELMFKVEAAIVAGPGAGNPLGVLNSPALITVPAVGGQASGTVVSENIDAMLGALWAPSYNSEGTIWIYNQALLPQLSRLATSVGTAGSESKLWQWAGGPDQYDLLGGFPAIASEYCPFTGSTGDIILCDFSRYMIIVRELLRAELSIHVLFLSDTSTFKFVTRIGGQPIDRSPVSAANGGPSGYVTSPFVALAPRP